MSKLKILLIGLMTIGLFQLNAQEVTTSSNLASELSFSAGISIPAEKMKAKIGPTLKLDYKLLNKSFGLQTSIYYIMNPMDTDALKDLYNASSATADPWKSVAGSIKMIGRINGGADKSLYIDLSFGFGVMRTTFETQSYTNSEQGVTSVRAAFDNSTTFIFDGGARVSYKLNDLVLLYLNYDFLWGYQNYLLLFNAYTSDSSQSYRQIDVNYSLITIGVTSVF